MKQLLISIIFCISLHVSWGQNVSITPKNFSGDTNHFAKSQDSIWLNNDSAVTSNFSTLSWSFASIKKGTLTFKYYFGENASSSNFSNIKLFTDSTETRFLSLRLGHTNDNFSLWSSSEGDEVILYESLTKIFDFKPTQLDVSINFSNNRVWVNIIDLTNSIDYYSDTLTFPYESISSSSWEVKYSKTRATKFSINNWLLIGEPYTDTQGPVLISEAIIPENTVQLNFDETTQGFEIFPKESIQNITKNSNSYLLTSSNDSCLKFDSLLVYDQHQNKTVITDKIYSFDFIKRDEIIITEIMADPLPKILLEPTEYVELYNTTKDTITLTNWSFTDKSNIITLPTFTIFPRQYLTLSRDSLHLPNNIVIPSLPSLNNSSDELKLLDNYNRLIHFLKYSSEWHTSSTKKDGGWSMELIDLSKPCLGEQNWMSSTHFKGGTPGLSNSVSDIIEDLNSPQIEIIRYSRDSTLIVQLNKRIKRFDMDTIQNGCYIPSYDLIEPENNTIKLRYSKLEDGIDTIYIKEIEDCSGNINEIELPIYTTSENIDTLILNEVLFNPLPYGADFIELYNPSDKAVWLDKLCVYNKNELGHVNEFLKATDDGILAPPQLHVVLTEDKNNILMNYPGCNPLLINEVEDLPKLPDEAGNLFLCDSTGQVIDSIHYTEDLHNPFLGSTQGVSLEKTKPQQHLNSSKYWKSASSTIGFASPTELNSMYNDKNSISESTIELSSNQLTPNSDGSDDYLKIHIGSQQNGSLCSINTFDINGKHLHTLYQNETLGYQNMLEWDGYFKGFEAYNNTSLIILVEILHQSGETEKKKFAIHYQYN